MVNTENCGGHEPGDAEDRADHDQAGHDEQVQVIATTLQQLVLLPVDDDGGDLLVHEEEDGEEEGRNAGQKVDVPEFSSLRD